MALYLEHQLLLVSGNFLEHCVETVSEVVCKLRGKCAAIDWQCLPRAREWGLEHTHRHVFVTTWPDN